MRRDFNTSSPKRPRYSKNRQLERRCQPFFSCGGRDEAGVREKRRGSFVQTDCARKAAGSGPCLFGSHGGVADALESGPPGTNDGAVAEAGDSLFLSSVLAQQVGGGGVALEFRHTMQSHVGFLRCRNLT